MTTRAGAAGGFALGSGVVGLVRLLLGRRRADADHLGAGELVGAFGRGALDQEGGALEHALAQGDRGDQRVVALARGLDLDALAVLDAEPLGVGWVELEGLVGGQECQGGVLLGYVAGPEVAVRAEAA